MAIRILLVRIIFYRTCFFRSTLAFVRNGSLLMLGVGTNRNESVKNISHDKISEFGQNTYSQIALLRYGFLRENRIPCFVT